SSQLSTSFQLDCEERSRASSVNDNYWEIINFVFCPRLTRCDPSAEARGPRSLQTHDRARCRPDDLRPAGDIRLPEAVERLTDAAAFSDRPARRAGQQCRR